MFCVYVHFFDMKTKKNEIKKSAGPGFGPTNYVSGVILTNHTTTVESTTSLSYQRISSQLYQEVYFGNCSKTYRLHTIHHEKLYIQCLYCNNLFMHKGQDQVNFVEVYQISWLLMKLASDEAS